MVFAHHYNPLPRTLFASDVINEGYTGVTLFFVLSGFLIAVRYDGALDFKEYIKNRFARIYPLYFLLTTLTFVMIGNFGWVYIANITLIKGFFDDLKFTGISQGWSLTVEETFYFLAPLIFLLIRKNKLAWLLFVVFLLIGFAIYRSTDFMLIYTFFGRAFDFFAGIFLAKMYQARSGFKFFTWAGVFAILASVVLLAFVRDGAAYGVQTLPGLLIHHMIVPAATALLLFGLLSENTWLQKFLSTPQMQLLGKSSYAFYLVHIGFIAAWLSDIISSNPIVLFVLLNCVAIALYYSIERPLRKLLSHR